MHSMPYVGITENETGDLQFYGGIFAEVFKELARSLNFSFTVTKPSDGEWGSLKDDGTWSGMVGQLQTKQVDFGMYGRLCNCALAIHLDICNSQL